MATISNELNFTERTGEDIAIHKYGKEWPIVYIIYNDDEAYVGETLDARVRLRQHYDNPERRRLEYVRIISDDTFNKSAILDLESFLISHMASDGRFKKGLQNGNAGLQKHNYYQKNELYEPQFKKIWEELVNKYHLAKNEIEKIQNTNLFKYSPYKALTPDQYAVATGIIKVLSEDICNDEKSTFIVNGSPGTGKTILGTYLVKLFSTKVDEDTDSNDERLIENLQKIRQKKPNLKIGLVVSMVNLRNILKKTFKDTYGLTQSMVYGPSEIANSKETFDILIVDEAHRLKATRAVGAEIGSMQKNNIKLGLGKNSGTQLDWIIKKSKHQILLYDSFQTIKKADIGAQDIRKINIASNRKFDLTTQIRCMSGGEEYINFIRSVFEGKPFEYRINISDYDFRIFDSVKEMTDLIKKKDAEKGVGLCRNIAGYGWEWKTKDKINPQNAEETEECIKQGNYDIEINGNKYVWNVKYDGWISSPNSVNEVGCIHTVQGFDLNYAGVIIGNELRYDKEKDELYIVRDSYYDKKGKELANNEELMSYILNIYYILCTRGMRGTFIYACDDNLREYLKQSAKVLRHSLKDNV